MKWRSILAGALASVFGTLFIAGTASADVRIVNDPGGEVSSYLRAFHEVRASGERIVIDGPSVGMHAPDGHASPDVQYWVSTPRPITTIYRAR